MASKNELLSAVKNYEELVDWLNAEVLPSVQPDIKLNLLKAVKLGYKNVATLTLFIESKHD